MAEKKKTCFIIMPITTPDNFLDKYRDGKEHFKHVLDCLFIPSVKEAGFNPIPPKAKGSDLIQAEIIRSLETSDLVLCDMSCLNPNVFFEYGIRTAINKPVCVVKDELTEKVPFDTAFINYLEYSSTLEPWELKEEVSKFSEHIKNSAERSKGENGLWKYFGMQVEAKPYTEEAGVEDKIDYLTMQVGSLREMMGSIQQGSGRKETLSEPRDSWVDAWNAIYSNLPVGVTVEGYNRAGYDVHVAYKGEWEELHKAELCQYIEARFGIQLRLTEVVVGEAEDYLSVPEGND